jgi:hypothetical protein
MENSRLQVQTLILPLPGEHCKVAEDKIIEHGSVYGLVFDTVLVFVWV